MCDDEKEEKSNSRLFGQLAAAVVDMDENLSVKLANQIVHEKRNILAAIESGLVHGMALVGDLYENGEYFIPDLLMCAEAMNAAMKVFEQNMPRSEFKSKGRIVIGTIQGDTHDIGKNIVALIIRSAGYDVLDLGRDISPRTFVDQAVNYKADIIAISTLLTTTMNHMGDVIQLLKMEGKRELFKVMIGGKPVSQAFAHKIGADYYSANAGGALRLVQEIMQKKNALAIGK